MKRIAKIKVLIDRARGYAAIFQLFAVAVILLKQFKCFSFMFHNPILWMPVLFVFFLSCSILIGYLDNRLGILKEEQRTLSESNPILTKILDK